MALPFKIGILSFRPLIAREARDVLELRRAAVDLGHSARIFRNANFQFFFDGREPRIFYKNQRFSPPDVMIIRPSVLEHVDLEVSTVRQLQLMDIPVVNHYLPIARAKNKVRSLQILQHAGIPVPRTAIIHNVQSIDKAVEQVGSFPLILKIPQGSLGVGVSIIESLRSMRSMIDLIAASLKNSLMIIQEYVKEAKGKDIRVFVIGGRIIAAMERKAKRGEFRANFERGGSVALADLSEEEKAISLKAANVIGLDVAGIDVIRTAEGPKVLEVNSNPGIEGITKATGINMAEQIVKYAEKVARRKKFLLEKTDAIAVSV